MANPSKNLHKTLLYGVGALTLLGMTTASFLLASNPGVFGSNGVELTAANQIFEAPPFAAAPAHLKDDSWLSVPTRGADGTIFGLVRSPSGGAFIKLDEATGREVWRVAAPPPLAEFTRADGWHFGERFPALPITIAGDGVYLVAWQRTWALVASVDGAIVKSGSFPDAVPPVSAEGGACLVDGNYWIALEDGRDGGVMLSGAGVLADVRSDRPAGCLPNVGGGDIVSPLQNAHATPVAFPTDLCAEKRKGRIVRENAYCLDMRSDGGPERAMMRKYDDPVFRDGDDWLQVKIPMNGRFGIFVVGTELAWPRAFLSMVAEQQVTVENAPAPTSFEAKRVETRRDAVEVVAAVSREGAMLWQRSVYHGPYVEPTDAPGAGYREQVVQHRSLLLASHPDSPVKNLYVVKPGLLLAVDQATGETRFQVGTSLPLPGKKTPPGP